MERLRRCPFCGEKPVYPLSLFHEMCGDYYFHHLCDALQGSIIVKAKTKDEVIAAWNGEKSKEANEHEEV